MAQFPTNTITQLYWAESSGFITGRDAMGIQNSSVAIYSTLLPGITNVTERIRYYGFHCWLLDQYDSLKEEKLSYKHQYDFIRRAELTIAFLMQNLHTEFSAIPGKQFASDFTEKFKKEGSIDLRLGADKGKHLIDDQGRERSYWKYSSGAMGQYYVGVLMAFSLVKTKENYFILQPRGKELADAFASSLKPPSEASLMSVLKSGRLTPADLTKLEAFNISRISPKSQEWTKYIEILFHEDTPNLSTFQRRDSLLHYLEISSSYYFQNPWALGEYFFQHPGKVIHEDHSASLGWLIYYSQELIHFAIENIFNNMLWGMKVGLLEINSFVDEQMAIFLDMLKIHEIPPSISIHTLFSETKYLPKRPPIEVNSKLNRAVKEQHVGAVYFSAFELILQTCRETKDKLAVFEGYLTKNEIANKNGNIVEAHRYLAKNSEKNVFDFFKSYLYKILNDHQFVAFQKMGNGEAQVHKFLIEHNHLLLIKLIDPRMTNPRLGSVRNYLVDLKLIDLNQGELTTLGQEVLAKYKYN